MKKLDLYLGQTVAMAMLMALLGLVSILVMFTFLEQIEDLKNDYTVWKAAYHVAWSVPRLFYDTVPYAALIGCLTGLGVLASNSELIVLRAAGISTWRITGAAMKPALALVVIGALVGEFLLPDFERTARVVKEDAMELGITPEGGFWYREGNRFMHFRTVNQEGTLRHINQYFVTTDLDNTDLKTGLASTLWAESATYHPPGAAPGYWTLHNVILTRLDGAVKTTTAMAELQWETSLTPDILSTDILVKPDKMSMLALRSKIDHLEAQGLNPRQFALGFWAKLFQPVASLSLVFIAVAFIFGPLREASMGVRVVSGIIIGVLFKFLQDLLAPASLVFGFPPLIATLTPILVCLGIGYLLLKRAN